MTDCNAMQLAFARFKRRQVNAEFSGGEVSSDGGLEVPESFDTLIHGGSPLPLPTSRSQQLAWRGSPRNLRCRGPAARQRQRDHDV
jgi:hypothetical protein